MDHDKFDADENQYQYDDNYRNNGYSSASDVEIEYSLKRSNICTQFATMRQETMIDNTTDRIVDRFQIKKFDKMPKTNKRPRRISLTASSTKASRMATNSIDIDVESEKKPFYNNITTNNDAEDGDDVVNQIRNKKVKHHNAVSLPIVQTGNAMTTVVPAQKITVRRYTNARKSRVYSNKTTKMHGLYEQYVSESMSNSNLYHALLLMFPETVIETACQNINNHYNLGIMEWSELVLIQLCTIRKEVDIDGLQWPQLRLFVENNQWSVELTQNIKKFIGSGFTLMNMLDINHKFKVDVHKMNNSNVFIHQPYINYQCLLSYRITPEIIRRPYCNSLPMKFKKNIPQVF
ncbi:ACH96203.1 unknown protein [Kallithea virus]|uniref:Uncharacterized protein n=1 Tax=Kallithea virus TaxID=1654582 RepID=A0A1S5VG30_9VIRU|nr:ACH96203.1 unknown protein [Kallithea virus]AQN78602.1 ACH96203.1 unknown protein [Kallithea virus]